MARPIVLVVLACLFVGVVGVAACFREPAPTAEFARAKKAYDDAMAETADTSYTGPRWDDVVRLLRAVPEKNPREHHTAKILADDIDATRAKLATELKKSNDEAKKLLVVDTGPPLPITSPQKPASSSTAPKSPATSQTATTPPASSHSSLDIPSNKCGRECQDSAESCLAAAGCKQEGSKWSCADGSKMATCTNALAQCAKECGG